MQYNANCCSHNTIIKVMCTVIIMNIVTIVESQACTYSNGESYEKDTTKLCFDL